MRSRPERLQKGGRVTPIDAAGTRAIGVMPTPVRLSVNGTRQLRTLTGFEPRASLISSRRWDRVVGWGVKEASRPRPQNVPATQDRLVE